MRIGVLLRHYNQHGGGVWVYTRNIVSWLLDLDTEDEFVFFYREPELLGTYADHPNVREVVVRAPHRLLWDQSAVVRAAERESVNVLFNPKYSVPLRAKCRTVFVCHGLDWYVMPWGSRWIDRLNHRYLVPRFVRKADAIIAVSQTTKEHLHEYLYVPEEKVRVVYHGVEERFRQPVSGEELEAVRRRYSLPERYFLYVGQIYPPKNFGRLVRAYAEVGPRQGVHLVVAGRHAFLCRRELALPRTLGIENWVKWLGWVSRDTLPALYTGAEALLLPSLYEACPSPPLEAMACGCPVITSNRYGCVEVAGHAALLVDPENLEEIARAMERVLQDGELRSRLIAAGRQRVTGFTWDRCARETLEVLREVGVSYAPVAGG